MKEYFAMILSLTLLLGLFTCLEATPTMSSSDNTNRDLTGSYIDNVTTGYTPGENGVVLQFATAAYSVDWEYVVYAEMDFPTGITVVSATMMGTIPYNGQTGNGVISTWGDINNWNDWLYNQTVNFSVTVNIAAGFSGDMIIPWMLHGDVYGSPPHSVNGTVVIPEGGTQPPGILWSQMSPSGFLCASQEFEPDFDTYDCKGADDFIVTNGPWTINHVKFVGGFWNGAGPLQSVNIEFYQNSGGQPGTSIVSFTNLPYTETANTFSVDLPAGQQPVFNDGHYWISIQGRMDYAIGGQFGLNPHATPQVELERHWINPGGGFGPYTTWTAGSVVWDTQTERDFCFQLEGESGGGGPFYYFEDFEGGDGGWTSGAVTGNNQWEFGTPAQGTINSAHSGANAWMTKLAVNYENNANSWLMSPEFNFADVDTPFMSVWLNIYCEGYYDGMILESSINGGTTWDHVLGDDGFYNNFETYGAIPAPNWSGYNGTWSQFSTFLPQLANQPSVKLRFRFGSDGSVSADGMAVDDVLIYDAEPGAIEGTVSLMGGTGNVTNVTVSAGGESVHPVADGSYVLTLNPGDYTVTAELLGYQTEIVENVSVMGGEATTDVDFVLGNIEIAVDPLSITADLTPTSPTLTIPLTITNNGYGDLNYQISYAFDQVNRGVLPASVPRGITDHKFNPENTLRATDKISYPVSQPTGTRDMFDLLFEFPTHTDLGEFGVITDGYYIYTARWNDSLFYKFTLDGTFINEFSIPGITLGVLDMTFDGQYVFAVAYPGSFSNIVYKLDLENATLISQFTTNEASVGIAYDAINDGFWLTSGWYSPLRLVDRTGTLMQSINVTPSGIASLGWENVTPDGPHIWVYSHEGSSYNLLTQIEAATGNTVQSYDLTSVLSPVNYGGGMDFTNLLVPGLKTFLGVVQNQKVWVMELGPDSTWLYVSPMSGTVPSGGAVVLDVVLNAEDMELGTYTADIIINNNAQADPIIIPVTLIVAEHSPNPSAAHSPIPAHEAIDIPHNTPIGWTYTSSGIWTDPLGYKINMWVGDTSGDSFTVYVLGGPGVYYFEEHPFVFDYETTYFWQVIPTTIVPVGRSEETSSTRILERDVVNTRGDAEGCPIWTFTVASESSVDLPDLPLVTELRSNYPNPFNPETKISFSLEKGGFVTLDILNIRGQKVTTLVNEYRDMGHHEILWNGRDSSNREVASGIYFYRMSSGEYQSTRKMLMMK
ncbi:MAG: T9SS type A sorting domain-containing protein [Candidatus Cloacimonetes bacterium]|nr:T9SS type A sorting domain-containing protein [Candidatus Cloacimonadota bacterium]